MEASECSREDDVLAAIGTGRWPDRADAELRSHVAHCAICRDVVAVAQAFADGSDHAVASAPVADSAVVWWRAQLRARDDAARLAARPITVAQAISFASIIGLIGVIVGATSAWLQTGIHWLGGMAAWLDPRALTVPQSLVTAATDHAALIAAVAMVLLLIPIGVYFAVREPR